MNYILILFMVTFAFTAVSGQGFPTRDCPSGEHPVLYCPQVAEPSCDNPKIHDLPIAACDIVDCFCDTPNVRETNSGKCIPLSECPKNKKN